MAAEEYHFYFKRMLSQQSNRAAPVNRDTIQLLVTLSKARLKTYSKSCERSLSNEKVGEQWESGCGEAAVAAEWAFRNVVKSS